MERVTVVTRETTELSADKAEVMLSLAVPILPMKSGSVPPGSSFRCGLKAQRRSQSPILLASVLRNRSCRHMARLVLKTCGSKASEQLPFRGNAPLSFCKITNWEGPRRLED